MSDRPPPVAKKAGVSLGAIVTLVVAFLVLCVGMYYADTLRGVLFLRPWSKAGPIGAIRAYAKALEANDEAALDAVGGSVGFQCVFEGGRIVALKSGGAFGSFPPIPVEQATPSSFTPDQDSYYRYTADPPVYTVMLPAKDGGRLSFGMTRVNGKWAIISLNPIGAGKQ
ncbi:MAG TPA: hypothetical protein PLD23_22100 [Armatimonadota bacterium]|nr:hypothetical protein [Armatimonadota bacterium]HQK96206.1 hypothetical protein [Armatimonadota bacterium]